MKIRIQSCLEGARQARGVVVILDVFRAGNTVASLLAAGAPSIFPVTDLQEARALKAQHPDWLLLGERGGVKPEGFDLNNSPSAVQCQDLSRRPAILTTSAGTQGLAAAAPEAQVLIMATLVNAKAAASYIRALNPGTVSLVAIGLEARKPAVEDEVVAEYLAKMLMNEPVDYRATVRAMLKGPGADRLRSLGQWRDLAFCLRLDYLSIVPLVLVRDGRLVINAAASRT